MSDLHGAILRVRSDHKVRSASRLRDRLRRRPEQRELVQCAVNNRSDFRAF